MDDAANITLNNPLAYYPTGRMNDLLPSVELDYNQMAWMNLMQSGAIGGFWGNFDAFGQ
jgi:hypothetical protein